MRKSPTMPKSLTINLEHVKELPASSLEKVVGGICGAICTSNGSCGGDTWVNYV